MKIHYCFYCLYGQVFLISVRYSCYTSFLCTLSNIFLEGQSQFTVKVHDTQTSAGDNRFHCCSVIGIKFMLYFGESVECCYWTFEFFCLIRATVILNLFPTAVNKIPGGEEYTLPHSSQKKLHSVLFYLLGNFYHAQ